LSFAGYDNGNSNTLVWSTASELGNDYFTVEHSEDAVNWVRMENLDGAGNSSEVLGYEWTDQNVSPTFNYYRLSQTDFDGTIEYHGIVSIDNRPDDVPELIQTLNLLGEVVDDDYQGIRIEIFSDGSSRKIVTYK